MESTGRWSNGLGSLNPKCHYKYQEMKVGGGGMHPIRPLVLPLGAMIMLNTVPEIKLSLKLAVTLTASLLGRRYKINVITLS